MPLDIYSYLDQRLAHLTGSMRRAGGLDPHEGGLAQRYFVHRVSGSERLLALDAAEAPSPKIDTERMSASFVISTPRRDRYGDIVRPEGCKPHLKNYARNPRVFFSHQSQGIPIASARDPESGELTLSISADQIESCAYFHGKTPESCIVFDLIACKELEASSIGFIPVKARIIKPGQNRSDDDDEEEDRSIIDFSDGPGPLPPLDFIEWDMIEWSVVPIPANADCLAMHLSRGHVRGEKIPTSLQRAMSLYAAPIKTNWAQGFTPELTEEESFFWTKEAAAGQQRRDDPKILALPDIRQRDHYSCGAAAAMSVGRYFGVGPTELEEWKKALGTSVEKSTHPDAIESYLRSLGLEVECRGGMTIDDLKEAWLNGSPVICPVQDYGDVMPKEADFAYGHYLTVIGVALEHIFCQDSSMDNALGLPLNEKAAPINLADRGRVMIDEATWIKNWHDQDADGKKYLQYGIIVSSKGSLNVTETDTSNPEEEAGEATTKGVIGFSSKPKAQEDTPWNGPAEKAKADVKDLKIMCAWYDAAKPDVKSSYKFPHHKCGGGYKTVWKGVRAAMGALLGARGGANIPAADKKGVFRHLSKHYKEFGKEPPDFHKNYTEAELKSLFGDVWEDITRMTEVEQKDFTPAMGSDLVAPPNDGTRNPEDTKAKPDPTDEDTTLEKLHKRVDELEKALAQHHDAAMAMHKSYGESLEEHKKLSADHRAKVYDFAMKAMEKLYSIHQAVGGPGDDEADADQDEPNTPREPQVKTDSLDAKLLYALQEIIERQKKQAQKIFEMTGIELE